MYSVRKQFLSFWRTSNHSLHDLTSISRGGKALDDRQVYIYSSGILNIIWQSWNNFWRTLWLAYIMGGIDINKRKINPVDPSYNRNDAIRCLGKVLGWKYKTGAIPSYKEPKWGDIENIKKLSLKISPPGSNILSAFSVLGNAPKHLQIVRNAAIHLDKDAMENLRQDVIPYYTVSKIKYPTEIIYAKELATDKIAIKYWVDELVAFLQFCR